MCAEVLVIGAGMIGVATALQLVRRGHSVCLVDRKEPGQETSSGNAGIVQGEAMLPFQFPRDLKTLLQTALRRGVAASYHVNALPRLASPLFRYWLHSSPKRYEIATRGHSSLMQHALSAHEELLAECGAGSLTQRAGYHHVYRTARALDASVAQAEELHQRFGVRYSMLDRAALANAEPDLVLPLAGAIHWPDTMTVRDPAALVSAYSTYFLKLGGCFSRGDADSLKREEGAWYLETEDGTVKAEHVVIALGPWSCEFVTRFGYRLPLFVKRGYNQHFTGGGKLRVPMLDAERAYVLAPMEQGIRLTTGAEFALLDAPATPVQLAQATVAARELLDLPRVVEHQPWLGNRPCTPDMLPVLGAAKRFPGLWFNFGHAHQGFTLGPICGRLMAELIEGRQTLLATKPYEVDRF
ncbi:MAG: FAD-binding oxidoreductase [Burkholderiales bacterium]|nr:FAD-binding oxidoreductase [Burkholderiales bacterium]